MRIDLDEMERRAKARVAISADVDLNDDDRTLALIRRIRELETLGTEALNRLAELNIVGAANGVLAKDEEVDTLEFIRRRRETIAKGTCTP